MNPHYLLMCGGLVMLFGGHESTINSNHIAKAQHNAGAEGEASDAAAIIETTPDLDNQPLISTQNNKTPPHDRLRLLISTTEALGWLLVSSSGTDFDLEPATKANDGPLIHTGFQPSMVQVTNEALSVLRATHHNMQSLTMRMGKLPGAIIGTLTALVATNNTGVSENLHIIRSSMEGGVEDIQGNHMKLGQLTQILFATGERLTKKDSELQKALKLQVISTRCGEAQTSAVRNAIIASSELQQSQDRALYRFYKNASGLMNVSLRVNYIGFTNTAKSASTSPGGFDNPTVRSIMAEYAHDLVSNAGILQTLAEEYLYVSDRCLLTAERFRLISTLQHLPRTQAASELHQLVRDNKAALKDAEAFAKRKRKQNEKKTVEYERKIKAILKLPEPVHLGVAGSVLDKQAE